MRLLCLFFWLGVLCCSAAFGQLVGTDGIAALVNDALITHREVEDEAAAAAEMLRRALRDQPSLFRQKYIELMGERLEQLIEKQLILDDFKNSGAKVPESIIEEEVKRRIRQQYGDREKLVKTLKARGVSYESYRKRTHDEIVVEYMRHKNVSSVLLISPQKIEQAYQTNQAEYKLGDQAKLRVIILNRPAGVPVEEVRSLAAEILTKIEEGASFAEMATIYSEGSQRQQGGDWGWKERNQISRGIADVAFSLTVGQTSPILALARDGENSWMYQYDKTGRLMLARKYSDKGEVLQEVKPEQETPQQANPGPATLPLPDEFRLLRVEGQQKARTKSLAEVRDEIERALMTQERERLRKKWIEKLKARAFVRYF